MARSFRSQNHDLALSEVIGFILLLGVLVAAFALWMIYVVPINGREAEITHMNSVKDRFTDYKISLDSLWINSPYQDSYDPNDPFKQIYSRNGVTVSTSINLGAAGGNSQASGLFLPLLNPLSSPAVLSIQSGANSSSADNMTITSKGSNGDWSETYNMGVLEYQSQNYYWIQQTYYYQSGGVFLAQENGSTCRVSPPISIFNKSDNTASVIIAPINVYGVGSMGGKGPVRVDTRLRTVRPPIVNQTTSVNISVNVADYNTAIMWLDTFNASRSTGNITFRNKDPVTSKVSYWNGNSPPGPGPATAFINISAPVVHLEVYPVDYDVSLNSIASMIS